MTDLEINQIRELALSSGYECGRPLSEKEIAEYERALKVKFPISYREFLKAVGNLAGGDEILGSSREDWLAQPSILSETKELRQSFPETFHRNLIPVCPDGRGNYWCLVCDGPDEGKVIFWQYELPLSEVYPKAPPGDPAFWIEGNDFASWLTSFLADATASPSDAAH